MAFLRFSFQRILWHGGRVYTVNIAANEYRRIERFTLPHGHAAHPASRASTGSLRAPRTRSIYAACNDHPALPSNAK